MFLLAGAVLPFVTAGRWTSDITVGLIMAVSCLGLQVRSGWTGQISLMQAGLTGAAVQLHAYLFGVCWCGTGLRHHYLYAAAVTIAFTVAVSVAVALIGARGRLIYPIVATLAVQVVLDARLLGPPSLGQLPAIPTTRRFLHLDPTTDRGYYFYVLAVLLVALAGVHRLRRSRFGRAMVAVGDDPVSAAVLGISPTRARVGAFAVAGLLAGVAGVLFTPLYGDPPFFLSWVGVRSMVYLAVVVIAGSRSGTVLVAVAVAIAVLPDTFGSGVSVDIPSELLVAGPAMLAVVVLCPCGLGDIGSKVRSRARGQARARPILGPPVAAVGTRRRGVPRRVTWGGLVALSVTSAVLALSVAARHDGEPLPAGVTEYDLGRNVGLSAITAGPDGNLWFGEAESIGQITPDWQVTRFRHPSPREITRIGAAPGGLWFADGGGTSGRISTQGAVTEDHLGGGDAIAGPDGNLWVAGPGDGLTRLTPTGAVTRYPVPRNVQPASITAGPDGNLWFTGGAISDRIWRMTPTGRITAYGGLPAFVIPEGITSGPDGNLWFTGYGDTRIWRITPTGRITTFGGLPADARPGGLTAGPDGNLWFVYGRHDLGRIDPAGVITGYRLPGPDLRSLAAGPDGTLWFTAEDDDLYYPSHGKIGRIVTSQIGSGHPVASAPPRIPRASGEATDVPGGTLRRE